MLFLACSDNANNRKAARLKIFNATSNSIDANLESKSEDHPAFKVAEFNSSEYESLIPDIYKLSLNTNNQPIIQRKIGLSSGEDYTLIFYGKPEFSSEVNEATFSHKLHYVFEGAENYTKNAYFPGTIVFRDNIKLKKGTSALRAFHAAPKIAPVTIKIKAKKSSMALAKNLAYGKPVLSKHMKSGYKTIEVFMAGSSNPIIKQDYEFKSQKTYILVIEGGSQKPNLKILKN